MAQASSQDGLGALVGQLADGIGTLVSQHLKLARVELTEDARRAGALLTRVALLLPFLGVGYALLCVSAAIWLGRWLTLAGGLAAVGAVNLLAAGVMGLQIWSGLRQRGFLGGTVVELERSAALLREGTHAG